jgi:hypothetical protein
MTHLGPYRIAALSPLAFGQRPQRPRAVRLGFRRPQGSTTEWASLAQRPDTAIRLPSCLPQWVDVPLGILFGLDGADNSGFAVPAP